MKKYTKTSIIEEPRLKITYDEYPTSPREWSNLGYFITVDRNYHSPDKCEELERIVKETGDEANSCEDHMKLIKKGLKERTDEKVFAIYPINKYEHSGVVYSLGTKHGFDYSNNGFYIVTEQGLKEMGVRKNKKAIERLIEAELKIYNQYANGEVYQFVLFDDKGEVEDSCGGFYDIESIGDYLPKEWEKEDLNDYFNF